MPLSRYARQISIQSCVFQPSVVRRWRAYTPVIGHLKSDHRMIRNYLSGTAGDAINTLMAAAAYNMRHWMNKLPKKKLSSFVSMLLDLRNWLENFIFGCGNTYCLPCPILATIEN